MVTITFYSSHETTMKQMHCISTIAYIYWGSPSSPSILSLGRRDHFEERITLDRREIVIFSTDRGSGHLCSGREGILADGGILMTILL